MHRGSIAVAPARRRLVLAACSFAAFGAARPAAAGNFGVFPLRLDLEAQRTVVPVHARNESDRPLTLRAELLSWTMPHGLDQLAPTGDVVALPPLFRLAPGESRPIRIALAAPAPDSQRAFRLRLAEVPDAAEANPFQLRVVLQQDLPVYVTPQSAAPAALDWALRTDGGRQLLVARNLGGRSVRVLGVEQADGASALSLRLLGRALGDVLADGERHWQVEADRPITTELALRVRTEHDTRAAVARVART